MAQYQRELGLGMAHMYCFEIDSMHIHMTFAKKNFEGER